ncbi:DinB family protein [Thermosynechococcaceae cyanobacterium BACA0444]|uniref:DinB family protein n=1 Tax=Pseudocalidococcus azoricus BACA0444 TaxID=2918990 RepID=A0AAE4JWM6_9CYAN|nr:DinB family protein [Pseudocalidococcus azoricus]MDS3860323.1 DinB family protein [Pseudocalidococcus azoricus BACA0444]
MFLTFLLSQNSLRNAIEHNLTYQNTQGIVKTKPMGDLILRFLNHQTHHQGQDSVLLSQAGQHLDSTDLLVLIPKSYLSYPSKAPNP